MTVYSQSEVEHQFTKVLVQARRVARFEFRLTLARSS